ncbi:Peroxisomal biogenesis factor 3 [Termitomyces sp. T112]|nr:Peroxisomal biogenesis factor 3 [Termitomyces sp. T112]
MLISTKDFFYKRRRGLTRAATIIGGAYIVRRYFRDRLDEVKDRLEQERAARDNLKRRFKQTQENVSFTAHTLIETLSKQVFHDMDVEGLTSELQNRSKARQASKQRLERPPSSLASSIDMMQDSDTRSEAESAVASVTSTSYGVASMSNISTSGLQNWVESSSDVPVLQEGEAPARMSESIMTVDSSAHNGESSSVAESDPSDSVMSLSVVSSDAGNSRTTAEIWNEVKILTLTRMLTTLYSITLLSLLTSIQFTLLARSKYVQSVLQLEKDERMQDHIATELTLTNMLLKSGRGLEELMAGDMSALLDEEGGLFDDVSIGEDVAAKFLTMSWWMVHVGWKDIGERVRRGVEEAFEGVSLKSKLSTNDLHRLVSDVRRRVEYEITFEGQERRINFLSSLLPPTPETVHHVLTQGGPPLQSSIPAPCDLLVFDDISAASSQLSHSQHLPHPHLPSTLPLIHPHPQDPAFLSLLDETRTIINSSDFACVLESCLDRATEVLFSGLEKSVFVSSEPNLPPGEPIRIRLVGLLPGLSRWTHLALNAVPNELVDNVLAVREVECLSAITFAKFEDGFR